MTDLQTSLEYVDDEGEEVTITFPARYAVCRECEGHGFVLNEAIRTHAYSPEEFEETFYDEEDRAEYFKRGGRYDVPCPTCDAKRVVMVVDEGRLDTARRAEYELCRAHARHVQRWREEDLRTMRMESGGWG